MEQEQLLWQNTGFRVNRVRLFLDRLHGSSQRQIGLFAGFVVLIALHLLASAPAQAATYGQKVVAAVLLAEARGEGRAGMIAVAEVIRNRADRLGFSPLAVVKVPRHFSCLDATTPENLIRRFWKNPLWVEAVEIARMVYNEPDRLPGITCGATHYVNGEAWWSKGHEPVVVIGRHRFFRFDAI